MILALLKIVSGAEIAKTDRWKSYAAAGTVFGCTYFERSYFSAHYLPPGLFTANIPAVV